VCINLPASSVLENYGGRPLDVRSPELGKRFSEPREIVDADAEIEIVVRSRLLAEERVDAPAAFDPEVDRLAP
jgi:hypothetical protein